MLLGIKGRAEDFPLDCVMHDGYAEVWDFAAGSKLYCQMRDESGEGASTFPAGHLLGTQEYRISYNGKVWDGPDIVYNPYN